MTSKKSSNKPKVKNSTPKIILAIGAHPDDIDISCSGTIAKWVKEGAKAYYLVLTDGSKGSEDLRISTKELIKIRREEQQKAAEIIGAEKVIFLDFIDGELENTPALRKQIVKIIRQIKPTTVFCFDPTLFYDETRMMVNHPDHRKAGETALDCVYPFARNARTFPELLDECLEPHIVSELLMVNFSKANYFVDIKTTIDKKIAALTSHKSQFKDVAEFGQMIKQMNKLVGQGSKPKMSYAEGFIKIFLRPPS